MYGMFNRVYRVIAVQLSDSNLTINVSPTYSKPFPYNLQGGLPLSNLGPENNRQTV